MIDKRTGIGFSAETVFGCEDGFDLDAKAEQRIDEMSLSYHAGVIDYEPNSFAFQLIPVRINAPCTRNHWTLSHWMRCLAVYLTYDKKTGY